MKKYILPSLLSFLYISAAWGVPAHNGTFKHTQLDGTILSLRLMGDEYMHYYLNNVDEAKMLQGADGDFYPINERDYLAMKSAADAIRSASQQRRAQRMVQMQKSRSGASTNGPAKIGSFGTMTGSKKGIVILVNFADKAMTTGTQTKFNNMFNQAGYNSDGHIGSVSDYFKDQSYNQFNLTFDVVGPVTLSNNMSYYGGNNSSGNDLQPAQMAKDACNLVDSQVNFADYDWDSDGYVDQVFVIYAGYGENYSGADENTIWPHEWDFVSAGIGVLSVDGVKVKTYACCAELYGTSGSTLNGMGTACHEFSHCLGYPDSYDTDYSGGIGMDSYDIMCGGSYNGPNGRGEVPAGYTAYERWMAGWLTPTELNEAANITDMPALTDESSAYIIKNSANTNEYFLLENRQAKSWFKYFDSNTAGHGLFITHIDYNSTVWSNNKPNDDTEHQRLTWVPADKSYGSYNSSSTSWTVSSSEQKGDYFPGTSNVDSFSPNNWSSTGGKWFTSENGSYYSPHSLSEITESNEKISFKVDGGDTGTRYTITYNAGAGTCATSSWTQTTSISQSTTLPTCTINSQEWSFAGWYTQEVSQTTTKPSLKEAGSSLTPSYDITLYAVYTKTDAAGDAGYYTLDYSTESLKNQSWGSSYGSAYEYTASDGGAWVIKAYKNDGMQINSGKNASIKVPVCPSPISSIVVTDATARVLKFSSADYTGSNSPEVAASSSKSMTATLTLSGKGLSTGYIYTTDGSTTITKIVVNYGGSETTYYATNPEDVSPQEPGTPLAPPHTAMYVIHVKKDSGFKGFTVNTDSNGNATYTSSNPSVASVDPETGTVTIHKTGSVTITFSVEKSSSFDAGQTQYGIVIEE